MATALITGASSGIGAELARIFAANKHDVVLVARRKERLETLAQSLREKHGVEAHVFSADLTDPDAPRTLFDAVTDAGITIEFLVNNAGFGTNGDFVKLDRQRELDEVQLNVAALVNLSHLFATGMVERGHGRIMNIASTAGFQPGPFMSVYYATKSFVISFSEGLAFELKPHGVTVTAHCPGATATEFATEAGNDTTLLFKLSVAPVESVAQHAYRSMMRGKVVAIPGLVNKLGAWSVRTSPRFLLRWFTAKLNR